MCFYFTLEFNIYLDLFSVLCATNGFSFKLKYKKLADVVHVLLTTQNLVISRCCFAENGKEIYQELQRTCTAILFLIKPFVKWLFCCSRVLNDSHPNPSSRTKILKQNKTFLSIVCLSAIFEDPFETHRPFYRVNWLGLSFQGNRTWLVTSSDIISFGRVAQITTIPILLFPMCKELWSNNVLNWKLQNKADKLYQKQNIIKKFNSMQTVQKQLHFRECFDPQTKTINYPIGAWREYPRDKI